MDEKRYAALHRALAVRQAMSAAGLELEPMESPPFSVPLDLSDTLTRASGAPMRGPRGRALSRHGLAMTFGVATANTQIGDLAAPIQGDAELRALLLQVRYGALWRIGRMETVARPRLEEVLTQVEAELGRARR